MAQAHLAVDPQFRPTAAEHETCIRVGVGVNSASLVSGRLSLVAIYLPSSFTVTSITFVSGTTAAGTPTNQWFDLHDSSRALLRQTVDDTTTAWAANTAKTLALTSTVATTYAGLHYLGINVVAATPPTLRGRESHTSVGGLPPILHGSSTTGLTTTAPNPAAALTALADFLYAYVS